MGQLRILCCQLDGQFHVGAAVPIQHLIDLVTEVIGRRPSEKTAGLQALKRHASMIAGYQVQDVCAEVFFGKHHPVDSSEAAFKTAGSMAFRDNEGNTFATKADKILGEP